MADEARFDGGHPHNRFLAEELGAYVDWVPYTAELETGMGALWETWRLTGQSRLVEFLSAGATPPTPAGLDGYVTRADRPGVGGIPSYDDGHRVFSRRLTTAFPFLPVSDDRVLGVAASRERFAERVFAGARLRELFSRPWRPRDLVAFHTRHKLQILAHDPARYRQAGRLVAEAGSRPCRETEAEYRQIFGRALASNATRGRNANAMHRAFRHVGRRLDDSLRQDVLGQIRAYERGELPFSAPIVTLTRHAAGEGLHWAAEQTYLNPVPADLLRRLWNADMAR
ncbi:DUF523 and DUF1722 domain-containing protein [Actinoallomurus bryophytorum]|nr:DUF1722 domain-containing protein [Actinoallomurus bryophytorum]